MNKNCAEYQLELSCLIDGELEPEREAALNLHLQSCNSCQEFWRELESQRELFDTFLKGEVLPISSNIDWDQFQGDLFSKLESEGELIRGPSEERPRTFRGFSLSSIFGFLKEKPLLVGAALSLLFLFTAISIPYFERTPDVGDDCIVEKVVSRPKTKVAVLHTQVEDTGNPMTVIVINEEESEGKDGDSSTTNN